MKPKKADLEWYTTMSRHEGVPPRCPFATVHRCPRFYQSLSLFGHSAGSTKIDPADDEALLNQWEKSDLWPVTREQATSVSSVDDEPKTFDNFCPEATFERFGFFATYLHRYSDNIDLETAHARLGKYGTQGEDWRWTWDMIHPMHYTECPLYSLLLKDPGRPAEIPKAMQKTPDKIFDLKPSFYGLSVDVKALVHRVREWWSRKRQKNRETQ
jgi:hypothetical protein